MIDVQRWLYENATGALKAFAGTPDFAVLAGGLAFAVLFGFVHALMPGHGKIALVSYYLGNPSRLVGGLAASVILILTHVGSAVLIVIGGFAVLRSTLAGVGRAPAFEAASALMVTAIGIWLLIRALRHSHSHGETDSRSLAFATGLVPCPLTTFIMVYASTRGIVGAGLLLTGAMTLGMIATILLFVGAAILVRERALGFLARTAQKRERLGRLLEAGGAAAVIAFGLWMFANRSA
jgi:ABC-type nickel/cobalt efflux system permease component RcnA